MNKILLWPAAAVLGLSSLSAQAIMSPPLLADYGFNIDGDVSYPFYGDPVPANVNTSLFDDWTGLGTITATITGAGSHNFDAYFDHDISNTTDNELGSTSGSVGAGQSWEVDGSLWANNPGDIDLNFEAGILDNTIGNGIPDDVAMAMGWDFDLTDGQTAEIILELTDIAPLSGFFLAQSNMVRGVSNYDIFLTGTLNITGGCLSSCNEDQGKVPEPCNEDQGKVPEPSILLLMSLGLAGMVASRRKEKV